MHPDVRCILSELSRLFGTDSAWKLVGFGSDIVVLSTGVWDDFGTFQAAMRFCWVVMLLCFCLEALRQ